MSTGRYIVYSTYSGPLGKMMGTCHEEKQVSEYIVYNPQDPWTR